MKYFEFIKKENYRIIILFAILFFYIAIFTHSYVDMTNPASRFLTMESIVENGSFIINEKHGFTDDKILRDGNYYSSKPPVLTIIGSGIYYLLHHFFHLDFPNKPYFFIPNLAVYLINLILIGGTYFLLLFYFYKTLILLNINRRYHVLLILGLAIGTLYLTYSITLNNHIVAGSFLFVGFYYLLKIKINKPEAKTTKKYLLLASLLISLSAVIDLPVGLVFFALFLFYLFDVLPKKRAFYYLIPALPIFALHLFFNYQITGDFLPPQFHPEYGDYNNVVWNALGGLRQNQGDANWNEQFYENNIFLYSFNILFGSHGLFSYSPILIFSILAIYKILRYRTYPYFKETALFTIGFLIIFLFYVVKIRVYTGCAYGYRWFIAFTPLLYFFSLLFFTKKVSSKFITVFIVILIISFIISFVGFLAPWGPPNFYIEINNTQYLIRCPFVANLVNIYNNTF